MVQSTRKYKAPGSGGSGGSGKSSLTDQAREERYNVYSEKADVLAKGKPEEVALALTEVNPVGKTYSVVDEAYVIDSMTDEKGRRIRQS